MTRSTATESARIELAIDIFDAQQQLARAQQSLTPEALIAAIIQEFRGDPDQPYLGAQPERYALLRASSGQPLADGRPLAEQGLADGERLMLSERPAPQPPGTTAPPQPTYLRDLATAQVYRLHWLPALIGRPSSHQSDNDRLAIDLSGHPQWSRVSRRHARIRAERGQLLIESLAEENPVVLLDQQGQSHPIAHGSPCPLHHGDTITLVNSGIQLRALIRAETAVRSGEEVQ